MPFNAKAKAHKIVGMPGIDVMQNNQYFDVDRQLVDLNAPKFVQMQEKADESELETALRERDDAHRQLMMAQNKIANLEAEIKNLRKDVDVLTPEPVAPSPVEQQIASSVDEALADAVVTKGGNFEGAEDVQAAQPVVETPAPDSVAPAPATPEPPTPAAAPGKVIGDPTAAPLAPDEEAMVAPTPPPAPPTVPEPVVEPPVPVAADPVPMPTPAAEFAPAVEVMPEPVAAPVVPEPTPVPVAEQPAAPVDPVTVTAPEPAPAPVAPEPAPVPPPAPEPAPAPVDPAATAAAEDEGEEMSIEQMLAYIHDPQTTKEQLLILDADNFGGGVDKRLKIENYAKALAVVAQEQMMAE